MREGTFLKRNIERWSGYMTDTNNPDELALRFVNLVDDLSYAKTHYPNSKTTQFLNGISSNIYFMIFKNKKAKHNRFLFFWKYELPYIMSKYHKYYLFTFCFFILFCLIGALSNHIDPQFIRDVMGDQYVNMTEENISKGDPFGVYKDGNSFQMFLMIAANNINVALKAFTYGIVAGIGTMYILIQNGIMLGSFQQMFIAKNLGMKFILVVGIHGVLEISAIVIAGTAGLILGLSYILPGTYLRKHSFLTAARDSVKILISLIPIFILAAFLESYITRYSEMPLYFSIPILVISLGAIIFYYIIYPIQLKRKRIFIPNITIS